jgi:hypothetical protein
MTVMLSDAEFDFREALEKYLGTDGSSIMRQAMLKFGRDLGLDFPLKEGKREEGVGKRRR